MSYVHLIATEEEEVIPKAEPMENSPYKIKGHAIKKLLLTSICHCPKLVHLSFLVQPVRRHGKWNLSYWDSQSDEG